MADNPQAFASGAINSSTLADAYSFLHQTLDDTGVRATAAFVSAFASERGTLQALLPELEFLSDLQPDWFRQLMPRLRRADATSLSGLEGHQFWEQFAAAGHEMAWHGGTHLLLSDNTPTEAVDTELSLARRLEEALGQIPRSVIFPRNQIGHLDRLRTAGFETYRDSRGYGLTARVASLARELHAWDKGDCVKPELSNGWKISPAGHFLNWPNGVRRGVPIGATIRRWKSILRSAAECGGCVHMWFHPHNLITAPAMRTAFAMIMEEVRVMVKSGDIHSLSMAAANSHYGLK